MRKLLAPVFVFVFVIIITLFVYQISQQSSGFKYVDIQGRIFKVEIADTAEKQTKGLSNRSALPVKQGLLFIFKKEEVYPFWMKDMLFPLDIIWFNQNKEVVFISENNQPCRDSFCQSINPGREALYVLEVNAGVVKTIGLKMGEKIEF